MQQQPPSLKFDPHAIITTENIQKCLEENKNLILAIMEYQNLGKFQECAQYQAVLQKNLMSLAAIADAQPPTPQLPPNLSQAMQMPANTIPNLANSFMQPGGSNSGQKLLFQFNSPRTLDQQQQQQLLQFQQQQQVQAQMGIRPGAQNGLFGMNQAMQSSFAGGNLMDGRGSRQEGYEATPGSNAGSHLRST
ncbi:SSXT-like protein [Artemisia annua]|uniref:SSXT-like protein n=1 Tax=Artemisia annua TaxID=35608 RepID=A0A2U1LK42_ARTAN|nr:SSXT-like protein [Artemisia annua]